MVTATKCRNELETHTFEDILEQIGGFGWFQVIVLVVTLGFEIPLALICLIPIFSSIPPEYWNCNGVRISHQAVCFCNGTLSAPVPYTSVVSEWNLVCDFAWVVDLITSAQMIGMMVGVLSASQLSDWYGRKLPTLGSALFLGLGSALSAISPNPYVYATGRVMCGAGFAALINLTGVYAMEFLTVNRRALIGSAGPYGWGTVMLGVAGYFVRPWRTLAWVTTAPLLLYCPLLFLFIPESPRFLIRQGRLEEASTVINYIAKVNGRPEIPIEVVTKIAQNETAKSVTTSRLSYFDLFRRSDLRQKTFCLFSIWFAWSLLYFGIYFNMKNIPSNLYVSVASMGLADILGFPLTLMIINSFGRRKSVVVTMSLGAAVMVTLATSQIFVNLASFPAIVLILCTLGKFFLAMARCSLKCFTGESYPTDIRSIGAGICGLAGAIGAAICPQVVLVGSVLEPSVPFFVFALVGIGGSAFSFLVAETSGKILQESVARRVCT